MSDREEWRTGMGFTYDDPGRRMFEVFNDMVVKTSPAHERMMSMLNQHKISQLTILQQRERMIDHGHFVLPPCMRRRIRASPYADEPNFICSNGAGDTYFADTLEEFIARDAGMEVEDWASNENWEECEKEDCEEECCGISSCTPCHDPDTIELSQPINDEGLNSMEMSMTVNREKLIQALTEKRDEVKERLQTKVDETQVKVDEEKESSDAVVFLEKLTELVKDGKVRIHDYHGREKSRSGGRTEVLLTVVSDTRGVDGGLEGVVPHPPVRDSEGLSALISQLERYQTNLSNAITPYNAALQLLEMSDEDNVGIPASEYQRLLAGNPPLQG